MFNMQNPLESAMRVGKAQPARSSVVACVAKPSDGPAINGPIDISPKTDYQDMMFYAKLYEHYHDLPKYHGNAFKMELIENAKLLASKGKGILASDESNATCGKRFKSIGVENTEENRRAYRELLYSTPGLEKYIVGVIMYDETARQKTKDGVPFIKYLA